MSIEVQWFSGTGPGGQHRNKRQNCCRVRDTATGLSAQSTRHRSREANEKAARKYLQNKLDLAAKQNKERRNSVVVVRTYHFVRNEMIDHATGDHGPITDKSFDQMVENHRFGHQTRETGR